MYRKRISLFFLWFSIFLHGHRAEENIEVSCNVNIKRAIQCISEKFLSLSVDPAVILAGVNLSEISLKLAKHLNPAFIRIAGPTTQFIRYEDEDTGARTLLSDDGNSIKITPSIWFGINEWLKLAKLTPVFGISDADRVGGAWNPNTTIPLFDISNQLNISCYWQLGYDSSEKNETRYKQDLNILHYIMSMYGKNNETWKLVGSDISVMPADRIESMMMELYDVVETVMWEPNGSTFEEFSQKDLSHKILQHQSFKSRTNLWTTIPKSETPAIFSSALLWAKQIGNAAKMGYDVVFRQPRIYELFTHTPIYWCSLLHKKLMGCHVLETKTSIFQGQANIFAHCTKKQNSFVRRGALTVMIVNDQPKNYLAKLKLGTAFPEKSMEVQSYILTSTDLNSTDVYLNGKLLTMDALHDKHAFDPKIRRTKTTSNILLSLPPSSIGFFVLPGARVPACIEKEKETKLLLEEIEEDQNTPLSEEVALQLGIRGSFKKHNLLEEITQNLKQEMMSDEKYYNTPRQVALQLEKYRDHVEVGAGEMRDGKNKSHFLERIKLSDKHKRILDLEKKKDNFKKYLLEKAKPIKIEANQKENLRKIELNSEEMERILKERAVERAAQKNVVFTNGELEALIRKARKGFDKPINLGFRKKRAINKQLLKRYSQNNHRSYEKPQHRLPMKNFIRNSKYNRNRRAVNIDLLDLKSKIAARKRFWDDKRDELLGNSLTIKEGIKDKIRELKSHIRFRRDINMDLLDKNTNKKIKGNVLKKHEPIEATIRESWQDSGELLEDAELTHLRNEDTTHKGEIYAELADPEDLDQLELFNNVKKNKKYNFFEKKGKPDLFANEYLPTDPIVPTKRKSKISNQKGKAQDKLHFLTTSEEFTDVEEDFPCIHEYFGEEYKPDKISRDKAVMSEMNEYFDYKKIKKRAADDHKDQFDKRDAGITLIQISNFDSEISPLDFLQDLFRSSPVIDKPFFSEIYNVDFGLFGNHSNNTFMNFSRKDHTNFNGGNKNNNKLQDQSDDEEHDFEENAVDMKANREIPNTATTQHSKGTRRKRSADKENKRKFNEVKQINETDKSDEEKRKRKKYTSYKNLNEQMHTIRERLQERKDEIDKMVQKQIDLDKEKKEIWKKKLNKKKKPLLMEDIKLDIQFPQLPSRLRVSNNDLTNSNKKLRKRSISNTKNAFGNYYPNAESLKLRKRSAISSLKKDAYVGNVIKKIPPNDCLISENKVNKCYSLRSRRFIDTDVDINENAVDSNINEIRKDDLEDTVIENIEKPKHSLPNDVNLGLADDIEHEIMSKNRIMKESEKLNTKYDYHNFESKFHEKQNTSNVESSSDRSLMEKKIDESVQNIKSDSTYTSNEENLKLKGTKTDITPKLELSNHDNNTEENMNDTTVIDKNRHEKEIHEGKNKMNNNKQEAPSIDVIINENGYKLKLSDREELDVMNINDDLGIKLMHHNVDNDQINNNNDIVPEITVKYFNPFDGFDQFLTKIEKFISNIGEELKGYLREVGIN